MKTLSIPLKFDHWNEYSSVVTYADPAPMNMRYFKVPSKSKDTEYIDPNGTVHVGVSRSEITPDDYILIAGDVQRWTHPLSEAKIPYKKCPKKIFISHTSGWSPWDQEAMIELALMQFKDPVAAQHCSGVYFMSKKFYNKFMQIDWKNEAYITLRNDINECISRGVLIIDDYEPSQFWLSQKPQQVKERNPDIIGVALNWCEFLSKTSKNHLRSELQRIHEATGKKLHIKMHHFSKNFRFYIRGMEDYIIFDEFEDLDKYKFMDMYETYLVDGTGLGYEIAYRARLHNTKVNLYYFEGLEGRNDQFLGIEEMGVLPVHTHNDLINGCSSSNYPSWVIDQTYPYDDYTKIPNQLSEVILRCSDRVDELYKEKEVLSDD